MTIKPREYNDFVIYQGATFKETLVFTNKTTGDPIDLSDAQPIMMLKKTLDDTEAAYTLTNSESNTITIDDNKIIIEISAEDTLELDRGTYVYDLKMVFPDRTDYYIYGKLLVEKRVSNV